jgi:twitching motility protein PilT
MTEPHTTEATESSHAIGGNVAEVNRRPPRIHMFLKTVASVNGSDLHLKADVVPRIRVGGELRSLKTDPLTPADMDQMIEEILLPEQLADFRQRGTLDMAYAMTKTERFRINIFRQRGSTSLAARRISPKVPSYSELRLPEIFSRIAEHEQGLVLMAGITGSGKSTTIAAMLEQINENKNVHIVTIEDPIEFSYSDKKAFINQREIGLDCESYEMGIRAMMREDPDVILIGEMRDRLTFQAAVQAAETGHLVFSTIHASSAPGAITRMLELFPKEMHSNIRQALAANLKAISFQKLVPALDPKVKRVPVVEVMLNSPAVQKYILEEREFELTSVIRNERGTGMIDFNDMLADLVSKEIISSKEALLASPNADELRMRMKGIRTSG